MFNLHHLHYFYVCAQTGSVTKAAEKLGISQPSLSMQIKQFERQIGIQILARSGRKLTLTPKGRELFRFSSQVFEITEEINRFIRKSEAVKEFDLRIGVSSEVERPFVADVLGKLVKIHSTKRISSTIISTSHQKVVDLLAQDQVDVVISNQKIPHAQPFAELHIPVILTVAKSEARLANSSPQSLLHDAGQSLILPLTPMVLGKETRDFLKKHNVRFVTCLQSNILACIVRAVEENVGAAFLPIAYVNLQIKKGLLQALGPKEGFWQHTLYLYAERGSKNEFLVDVVKIMNDLNVLN